MISLSSHFRFCSRLSVSPIFSPPLNAFSFLRYFSSTDSSNFNSSNSNSNPTPAPASSRSSNSRFRRFGLFAFLASLSSTLYLLSPRLRPAEEKFIDLYQRTKNKFSNTQESKELADIPTKQLQLLFNSLFQILDDSVGSFSLIDSALFPNENSNSNALKESNQQFHEIPSKLSLDSLHSIFQSIFSILLANPELISSSIKDRDLKCLVACSLLPNLPSQLRRESAVLLSEFASNRELFVSIDSLGDFPLQVFFSQFIDSPFHPHLLDDSLIDRGAFIFRPREERRIRRSEANAIWRLRDPPSAIESEESLIAILRGLVGLDEFVAEIVKRREIAESGELNAALQNFSSLIISDLDVLAEDKESSQSSDSGLSFGLLSRYTYSWSNSVLAEKNRVLAHKRDRYFRLIRLFASLVEEQKFRKQLLKAGAVNSVYDLFMNYQEEPRVQLQSARFVANLLIEPPVEAIREIESSPLFAAIVDFAHMDPLVPEPHFIEFGDKLSSEYWEKMKLRMKIDEKLAANDQLLIEYWQPPAVRSQAGQYDESLGAMRNLLQAQSIRALANLQSATDSFVLKRIRHSMKSTSRTATANQFPYFADEVFLLSPFLRAFNPIYLPDRLLRCSIPSGGSVELSSTKDYLSQTPRKDLSEFFINYHFPVDYNPKKVDIFLVHGLLGNALSTWRTTDEQSDESVKPQQQNAPTVPLPDEFYWLESNLFSEREVLWPRDWLPMEFPNSRIISIGFRSFISGKAEAIGSGITIGNHSDEALAKLILTRFGQQDNEIIFLTHSMGGLIVKHLIVKSSQYIGIHSNPAVYKNIIDKWRGVVFFSTPHFGALLHHVGARTKFINMVYQPSIEVKDLSLGHPALAELNEKFSAVVEKQPLTRILNFGESESTPLLDGSSIVKIFVVLPNSSNPIKLEENNSTQPVPIDESDENEDDQSAAERELAAIEFISSNTNKHHPSQSSLPIPHSLTAGSTLISPSGRQEYYLAPHLHHFNICKPKSENDELYQKTINFIRNNISTRNQYTILQ